jgi:hypothetical protein
VRERKDDMKPSALKPIHVFTTAALILFLCSFSSCERDFPNPNAPSVDDVPVQSLVTGTEAGMRTELAIYLRIVSIIGREAYYFEPADPRYTGEPLENEIDPGGFLLLRPWQARYRVVANCNILLDRAAALGGGGGAGIEGFAKTIMAYQLLLNLNYLDDNGIKLDFSGDLDIPFATKEESFQRIGELLDEAYASLTATGTTFPFTLTSGFAGFDTPADFAEFNRAIKARVSVYRADFTSALQELGASFMNTGASLDLGIYHIYGTGLGDQLNEIYEDPTAPFIKYRAHPSFQTDAEAGDTRFSSKVVVRPDLTDVFDDLSSNLVITITSSSIDVVPIIRNEELILLSAEAKIGTGDFSGAEADMNVVRTQAGLPTYAGTNASNALDRLLYEKRYSLFAEGHRWVDMRRYGRLGDLPIDRPGRDAIVDDMPRPETEVKGG